MDGNDTLARAVIADPKQLAEVSPRLAALVEVATIVSEQPWSLTNAHRTRFHAAGLDDESLLHAVMLSAFFGHLNRIADVTDVPLDYEVRHTPPRANRDKPPMAVAPKLVSGRTEMTIAQRPATAQALTQWRIYIFDRDSPLPRRQRTVIARWVAEWLGDGTISSPADLTFNPLDEAIRVLAEQVTLAPWQVTDESFAKLRSLGLDDAQLFDACAVASSAGMFSRIDVALVGLARARSQPIPVITD
jgi:alkylhydroperoxidase family enzyme